jgi:prevent-host-death family protein
MTDREVPVAEVKARLSEYVSLSTSRGDRIVITRRGKPVAALVSLEDLQTLSQADKRKGLSELIGKWKDFEDIAGSVERIYQARRNDGYRDVPV